MFPIGTRVVKTAGVPLSGTVIAPFFSTYTDGSYRLPEKHEKAIFVQWDDGTKGWIHKVLLRNEKP